jgi:hypothetical protein
MRYPTTGDEFNKKRKAGEQKFPSYLPVEMPKPSVEIKRSPDGLSFSEWKKWKDSNQKTFRYKLGSDKKGACMTPNDFRKKYANYKLHLRK